MRIADPAVGPQQPQGFELGPLDGAAGQLPLGDRRDLATAHRAGIAGVIADVERVFERLAGQPGGPGEKPALEVVGGPVAEVVGAFHHLGRAKAPAGLALGMGGQVGADALGQARQCRWVGHRHLAGAAHGNGFQVFAAHHRPRSTAPELAVVVGLDHGVTHTLLAGRADHGDARFRLLQLLAQAVLRVMGQPAPQVGRLAQLGLTIVDPQVERALGLALHHQAVEAGEL